MWNLFELLDQGVRPNCMDKCARLRDNGGGL